MKKIMISTFFLFVTLSCEVDKNGIVAEIKNSSDQNIYDVMFFTDSPSTNLYFKEVRQGEKVKEFFDMATTFKSDGSYTLTFKRENNKKEVISGGYYTNGGSLDQKIIYEIKNDTVLISFRNFIGL